MASGITAHLGAWVAVSPWVLGYLPMSTAGVLSNAAAGSLVAVFGALRVLKPAQRFVLCWINAVLGGAIALSAWMFDYHTNDLRMWNSVVAGTLISMLASWSASTTTFYRRYPSSPTTGASADLANHPPRQLEAGS